MLKKIAAVMLAAISAVMLSACSDYVMTEKDLAVQKSIEGFWLAGEKTGYNTYDENGDPVMLLVVEFTSDFKYFLHECYIKDGYVMTYDPVIYSFKDEMFKVDIDGVAAYARIEVTDDGNNMRWITDDKADIYERITEEEAMALGIPEYDREYWATKRAVTEDMENADDIPAE